MEPVTHFLTGACIGRAGLNRLTAYATLAATLAAEAPDLDVVWSLGGPVVSLAHHRGITHTFLAAPAVALVVTGFVWLVQFVHRSSRSRKRAALSGIAEPQPVRWRWVFLAALIADLSHLLLDWTNNYGLRPFFPFNAHWYSGDLVFIAEPILWGLLLSALIFPALLGLADREVGARKTQFRGRSWAIFALTGMVALWCLRWTEHAKAANLVELAQVTPTPANRIALEPYPFNPFRWHALLETDSTWQTAEIDTRNGQVASDPHTNAIFKPPYTPAVAAARQTRLGQVYLDWSQWPVVREIGPHPAPGQPPPDFPPNRAWTNVQFNDLRFAYSFLDTSMGSSASQPLNQALAKSALSGSVYILDNKEEAGQFLNGREQK
jgi:inner membrane protein